MGGRSQQIMGTEEQCLSIHASLRRRESRYLLRGRTGRLKHGEKEIRSKWDTTRTIDELGCDSDTAVLFNEKEEIKSHECHHCYIPTDRTALCYAPQETLVTYRRVANIRYI
jgi:hypothetical protein